MPAWKVASGEVANRPLLDAMLDTGKPVLLSSGMSDLGELDAAVARVRARAARARGAAVHHAYPCPPEQVGLNMLPVLRERYGCPVGLSDHSGTIYPGAGGGDAGRGRARGARDA